MKAPVENSQDSQQMTPVPEKDTTNGGGNAEFSDNRAGTFQLRKLREGFSGDPQDEGVTQLQKCMQEGKGQDGFPIQRQTNNTGLPNQLKSGVENLSGLSMDDVKVHFNSSKPAQLQAHAYAQGTDIHIGPGQEKHLPHEAWHVVQQKQGRVKPTVQMKGKVPVNNDAGLEKEADVMGAKAMQNAAPVAEGALKEGSTGGGIGVHQMEFDEEGDKEKLRRVHQWLKLQYVPPEAKKFRKKIANILGKEPNSNYAFPAGEEDRVENPGFWAQNGQLYAYLEADRTEDDEEYNELMALHEKKKKDVTDTEQVRLNALAHKGGDYFHIGRPPAVRGALNGMRGRRKRPKRERLILNINSAKVGADIMYHIMEGWEGTDLDWRSMVTSAKFFGGNPAGQGAPGTSEIKYDKVVIYYERPDREEVVRGVNGFVPNAQRNEDISGFYNKIGKGMGIGEEKVSKLGNSFTTRRAETLRRWILNVKGWRVSQRMDENDFVEEAMTAVRARMYDVDVQEGTPIRPMPYTPTLDIEGQNAMLDGLTTGLGFSPTQLDALLNSL